MTPEEIRLKLYTALNQIWSGVDAIRSITDADPDRETQKIGESLEFYLTRHHRDLRARYGVPYDRKGG